MCLKPTWIQLPVGRNSVCFYKVLEPFSKLVSSVKSGWGFVGIQDVEEGRHCAVTCSLKLFYRLDFEIIKNIITYRSIL